MPRKIPFESAYQAVLGYLTPQAQALVAEQRASISRNIDAEVDKFGEELGEFIKKSVEDETTALTKANEQVKERIATLREELQTSSDEALAGARKAIDELESELNAYEDRWTKAGEGLRDQVVNRVRSTVGLPLG